MNVVLVQTDLFWEDPESNLSEFSGLFQKIKNKSDLIILPEMFSTGFTMNTERFAEGMDGETVLWMKRMAAKYNSAVCGSVIIQEENKFFNRFIFTGTENNLWSYDKRHLFSISKEDTYFEKGKKRVLINYRGWKICPMICYDLRFPVWSRLRNDYHLLVYSSNWPDARKNAWITLLKARAIENLSYVIGVNRLGTDGNGIYYSGNSMIINPMGEVIADAGNKTAVVEASLSLDELNNFRTKFPVLRDADDFQII